MAVEKVEFSEKSRKSGDATSIQIHNCKQGTGRTAAPDHNPIVSCEIGASFYFSPQEGPIHSRNGIARKVELWSLYRLWGRNWIGRKRWQSRVSEILRCDNPAFVECGRRIVLLGSDFRHQAPTGCERNRGGKNRSVAHGRLNSR
ncbi:MAG: hypothetical protein WB723_01130 [Candidatus Acidiferrales bacterium]